MDISNAIKEVRKQKGLKQYELADRLEITQSYMSLIENGKKDPSVSLLKRISTECDFPIQILMYLSLSESDISDDKKELFNTIDPHIRSLIKSIFE